jgi:hypothetical protein
VAPHDPASIAVTGTGVAVVVLLSSYLTARSVARIDPLVALRNECRGQILILAGGLREARIKI